MIVCKFGNSPKMEETNQVGCFTLANTVMASKKKEEADKHCYKPLTYQALNFLTKAYSLLILPNKKVTILHMLKTHLSEYIFIIAFNTWTLKL